MPKKKSVKPKANTPEETKAINILRQLEAQIDSISKRIGSPKLDPDSLQTSREEYASLKRDMNAIVKKGATYKGEASLNEIERNYLIPAVSEALCRLLPATNSHPHKSNWGLALHSAKIDLSHMRSQLEGEADGRE